MKKVKGFYSDNLRNVINEPCFFHGFFQTEKLRNKYYHYENTPKEEQGAKYVQHAIIALIEVDGEMTTVSYMNFRFNNSEVKNE